MTDPYREMTAEERNRTTLGAYRHRKGGPQCILPTMTVEHWFPCMLQSDGMPHAYFIASNRTGRLRCHGCRPDEVT